MATEFSISGQRDGAQVRVTWRAGGALTSSDGDATARWIKQIAAALDGTVQGLPGLPSTLRDHLSSPYTACALMRSVFPGHTTLHGALPAVETPPDGAVL